MIFSLIICTYMRPKSLLKLLNSVKEQSIYPNEIIIIDGSTNDETKDELSNHTFKKLSYFKVNKNNRGLTKQRNYGIKQISKQSQIICFLDDDVVLKENYFEMLITTYQKYPQALAVGGYIINEVNWTQDLNEGRNTSKFHFDGWTRNEPLRFKIRKFFKLLPDTKPGFMPTFSHGRSIGFLPPSDKIYEVEQIMGGVSSYKREIFESIKFSNYFEGYGLYEDVDFSLRLAKKGKLYVNTSAQLYHYHDNSGRPNKYRYGMMVVRNGWYVWRVKYTNPSFKSRLKWNAMSLLLIILRFFNALSTVKRKEAFTESCGRFMGWLSLIFNPPKVNL